MLESRSCSDPLYVTGLIYPLHKHYDTIVLLIAISMVALILIIIRRYREKLVFKVVLAIQLSMVFSFTMLFVAQMAAYYTQTYFGSEQTCNPYEDVELFVGTKHNGVFLKRGTVHIR